MEILPRSVTTFQSRFRCFFLRPPQDIPFLKPTSNSNSTTKSLTTVRSRGFDSVLGQRKMAMASSAPRRISGSEGGYDEGGSQAFEQEAFISSNHSTAVMADGFQSTLNRQSKWLVVAFFVGVVLGRHDAGSFWAVIGSVINAMLGFVLKRILNHERPTATSRSDPGMPSSHALSISFIFIYAILSIVEWFGVNVFTVICSGLVLALGSYLSWLRVSQRLHTISQVIVGACMGSGFAGLWYWWWRASVLGAFDSILWVRVLVIVSGIGSFLAFVGHAAKYWFRED